MDAKEIISKLTLMEKAALLSGKNEWESRDIPRMGIGSISFSDGPHGLRRQEGAGDHLGLNASLPHSGDLFMLRPGPKSTSTFCATASSPRASPIISPSFVSQLFATVAAVGKHVAGSDALSPR